MTTTHFSAAVRATLDSFERLPPYPRLQPGGAALIPVFAALQGTASYLGDAESHAQAEALGLAAGVSCERISKATLAGDCRKFFVLHA